jgi:hypothetical protein
MNGSALKRASIGGSVHAAAWVLGGLAAGLIFQHSESRLAYSLLSGWWCALYCGYLFHVKTAAIVPAGILYVLARIGDAVLGYGLVYHDPPPVLSWDFVSTAVLSGLVFVSPILVNEFARLKSVQPNQ